MSYDADQLQTDIEGRLNSWPFFNDITIKADEPGVILDTVINALGPLNKKNGKCGAYTLVMMAEELVPDADSMMLVPTVQMAVQVFTNALFNNGASGTKKSNAKIRSEVRKALHQWSPNGNNNLVCDKQCGTQIASLKAKEGSVVGYELVFNMVLPTEWKDIPGRPVMTITYTDAVTVELSQAEGAEIRYTLDGKFPGITSPMYAAPLTFDFEASPTIRAVAYVNGYGSSIAQMTLIPRDLLTDQTSETVFDDQNYPVFN